MSDTIKVTVELYVPTIKGIVGGDVWAKLTKEKRKEVAEMLLEILIDSHFCSDNYDNDTVQELLDSLKEEQFTYLE